LLEPLEQLKRIESEGDYTLRLALLEELKTLPWASVWDYYCLQKSAPVGIAWMTEVKQYEQDVLSKR